MTVPLRALETSTGPQNQRKTMSRIDQIHQNLQKLVALTPDLEGALLVTLDGLPIASALAGGTDEDRVALAHRLLASRVSRPTMSLVTWCVRHHPEIAAGGVPYNLRRVTELAAELQNRTIADVVTAIPMTRAQEDRLRAILAWRIGTDVELNTTIDPSVIGGVKVSVRDLVMDSTVRSTVAGLRVRLTG